MPEVIILDAAGSVETAVAELRLRRLPHQQLKYLVIGRLVEPNDFIRLLAAGMDGYLRVQDVSQQSLERTIWALLEGEFPLPRSFMGHLVGLVKGGAADNDRVA